MKKTVWYTDPLNDDFALNHIQTRTIDASFPFWHPSRLWQAGAAALYWVVAFPLVFLFLHLGLGLRIRNRRALRQVKGSLFLYGNHPHGLADALSPSLIGFPRRAYVVAHPDAASIPGLTNVVQMLGALVLPTGVSGRREFLRAMKTVAGRRSVITIYPEAHVWPYYTGLRPFRSDSFAYPVMLNRPVIVKATTFRRAPLPFLPPLVTVTLSDPIWPDESLPMAEAREKLRGQVYAFLAEQVKHNQVEYIHYEQRESPAGQQA